MARVDHGDGIALLPPLERGRRAALGTVVHVDDAADVAALEHASVVVEIERRHGQAMFGFARRLGLTDDQAADSVQEALARLFRALRGGDEIDDPRAWAFRTAYRIAMDEHRLRRRIAAIGDRLTSRRASQQAQEPDHAGRLSIWAEVDRLPSRQRQVLYLRYKVDLAYDQIALVMGITPAGARAVGARGIAALRDVIDREDSR